MNPLERRYRRVLRLLPGPYRRVWEDEMAAAFLESMATDDAEDAEYLAEFGRPSWSEVASVVALAVRLRLGGGGASPRWVAQGQALRLVALMTLLANAAFGLVSAAVWVWQVGWIPWLSSPVPPELSAAVPSAPVHAILALAPLLWLPAYLALALGYRRLAWLLASLVVLAELSSGVQRTVDGSQGPAAAVVTFWCLWLLVQLPLLGLAAFHHDTPRARRGSWLIALPVALAVVGGHFAYEFAAWPTGDLVLVDVYAVICMAVLVASVIHLIIVKLGRTPPSVSWSLALAAVAVDVVGVRLVSLGYYAFVGSGNQRFAPIAFGVIEALAVAAVGLPIALRAVREQRRLPGVPGASAVSPALGG